MPVDVKIECPKCGWEPDGGAYWSCSCGHRWNTFETAGRCPSCRRQWDHTQCVSHRGGCPEWSPHLDWYRNLNEWLKEQLASVEEPVET